MEDEKEQVAVAKGQTARGVKLDELTATNKKGPALFEGNFSIISALKVDLEVLAGTAQLTVKELFSLQNGSVVTLSQLHNTPMYVRLNGKIIASGSLVVVGDNFGICINKILAAPAVD